MVSHIGKGESCWNWRRSGRDGTGSRDGHACHDGAGIMVSGHLELHAHEDIIDLGSGFSRECLKLCESVGIEVVDLDIVVELP